MSYQDAAVKSAGRNDVQSTEAPFSEDPHQRGDADELLPAEAISRDSRSSNDGHCLSNNKRAERVNLPTREGRGWARRNPDSGNRFQGGFRQSNMHTSRKLYRPNEFVLPGTVGGVDTESRSGVSYSIGNGKGWGGRRPNERFGVTEEEPVQSVSSGRSLARGVDCYSSGGRKSQWRDGEKDLVQEWTHPPFLQYPYQLNGRGRERRHGDFKTEDASRAEAPNSQQGSRGPEWFRPKEDCRQRTVEADRFSSSTKSTNALSGEVRNRMVSTERRELSYVSVDARRWERDQQEWDHNSLTSHDSQVQAWKMSSSYSQTLDGTAASRDCNPSERLPVKSCAVVKAVENMNEEGELENRRMREDAINAGIESMNIVITGTTNTPSLKIDDVGVSVRNEATERERKRPDCSAAWLLGEKYSNGSCEAVIDDLDKDSKIAAAVTDIDGQKGRGVHHHDLGHSNLDVSHSGQLLNAFADGDEETCRCTSNGIVSQITQFPDEIEATKQEQQRALGGEKLTMMKRLNGGSEGWGNVAMRQNSSARRINRMTTLLAPLALPSSVSKEVEADRGRSNLRSACYHEPVERQLTASPEDESHGKRCATSSSQFQLNEGSPMPPIMSVHRRNIEVPRLSNYTSDETDVCTISTTSAEGKSMVRLDEVNKGLLTSTVMPYHLGSQSATADSWHESKSYTAAGTVAIPPVKFFNGTQQWRVGGNRGGRSASVRELCADSSDRRALLLKGELVTVTSEEPEAANSTPSSSERAVRDYASSVGKTHNSQSNKQERTACPQTTNSCEQHLERNVVSAGKLTAEGACHVPVEQVHSAGDGRAMLPVANILAVSKSMETPLVADTQQNPQSPDRPTFRNGAACQTSSPQTPPFVRSSFRSSSNSFKGNKRIRTILNDCRLLENLPKVIRSENSSPRLWSGSEGGERSIDSAQKRPENIVIELGKTHSPILALLSSPGTPAIETTHYRVAHQAQFPASGVLSTSCTRCGKYKMRSSNEEERLYEGDRLIPRYHLTSGPEFGTTQMQRDEGTGEGHGKAVNGNESRIRSYTLPSQGSSTPQPSSAAALLQTSFDSQSDSLSASIVHTVIPRSSSGSAQDAKVMCEDQCHPNELRTGVVTLAESVPRSPVVISVASVPSSVSPGDHSTLPSSGGVRFQVSMMDVLSEEIWHLHATRMQRDITLGRKLHLRDMLYCCVSQIFPMCGLYMVGSSLNGFGTDSSDMDLCLMISHRELNQQTDAMIVLEMVRGALMKVASIREHTLIPAKVPILRLKFTNPFDEMTVDLNVNNSVAIRNTHLLYNYSLFDWRVRPLVSVIKEWAKRRGMNSANRSTFTSYSLVLMVIHYFQCGVSPPVLPSLQMLYPTRFDRRSDVCKLDMSLPLDPPPEDVWPFSETSTLSELLIGFLEYYALKFDYLRDAISVRLGKKVDRAVVARQWSQFNNMAQWNYICIEEPFTLSNTAHSIHSQMTFDAIKEAFVEGYKELYVNRDLHAFLNAPPIHIPAPFGSSAHLTELSVANSNRVQEAADGVANRSIQQVSFTLRKGITHRSITQIDAVPSTDSVGSNSQRDEKNLDLTRMCQRCLSE